ncbi:MAG TPA: hypothetical protein EYG04_07040 [Candidatus Poseidoniales archaeon]|jgi:response regulator of citrate/malate metabolism|nr:hypothetical protein [Candidatus Poseidoniales archaeon]
MRVLAFEDSFDIEAMLSSGGVNLEHINLLQKWTTDDALEIISDFSPDILLFDYFIPPYTGLEVLKSLNLAVKAGRVLRPQFIVAMSSEAGANQQMSQIGADFAIIKFNLATLSLWSKEF